MFGETEKRFVGGGRLCPPVWAMTNLPQRFVKTDVPATRVDVGIDPYKRFTGLHWCVRICGCILPGGQGRPPLRYNAPRPPP